MTAQHTDPFAGAESTPSVSFKDKPVGTSYTLKVRMSPELVQSRDFESGEPAFWSDGNAKMSVVTGVVDTSTGDELSLWAAKPSALFRALADAQKASGQIAVGGVLTVTFTSEKVNPDKPKLNPQKLYTVTYQPGDAFAEQPQQPQQQAWSTSAAAPAPAAPEVDQAAQMAAFQAWKKSQGQD